jgi:hypothetical protein
MSDGKKVLTQDKMYEIVDIDDIDPTEKCNIVVINDDGDDHYFSKKYFNRHHNQYLFCGIVEERKHKLKKLS